MCQPIVTSGTKSGVGSAASKGRAKPYAAELPPFNYVTFLPKTSCDTIRRIEHNCGAGIYPQIHELHETRFVLFRVTGFVLFRGSCRFGCSRVCVICAICGFLTVLPGSLSIVSTPRREPSYSPCRLLRLFGKGCLQSLSISCETETLTPTPAVASYRNLAICCWKFCHIRVRSPALPQPKRYYPRIHTNQHETNSCGLRFVSVRVNSWIVQLVKNFAQKTGSSKLLRRCRACRWHLATIDIPRDFL